MRSCLRSPLCAGLAVLSLGLLAASCSSSASSTETTSTTAQSAQSDSVNCRAVAQQYATIKFEEAQLGATSSEDAKKYAQHVALIASASTWLANHATGVDAPYRNYWRDQTIAMSNQITMAAKRGTSVEELIQYTGTAESRALINDENRVTEFYKAACPGLSA